MHKDKGRKLTLNSHVIRVLNKELSTVRGGGDDDPLKPVTTNNSRLECPPPP